MTILMNREKYMQEILAACEAMDDRALEQQLRCAKDAAIRFPREVRQAPLRLAPVVPLRRLANG
jgi:hypothetical protein